MTANTLTEIAISAKSHKRPATICLLHLFEAFPLFTEKKKFRRQQVYIVNLSGCASWPKHSMYCYVQGHLMIHQNNSDTRGLTLSVSNEELDSWDFSSLWCWFSEGESESFLSLLYQHEAGWTVQWCHRGSHRSLQGRKIQKFTVANKTFLNKHLP